MPSDGPFRGETGGLGGTRRRKTDPRRAEIRSLRRTATIDAAVGFAGVPVALFQAHAKWAPLWEILYVSWLPYVVAAAFFLWGAFNVADAVRLRREEDALS